MGLAAAVEPVADATVAEGIDAAVAASVLKMAVVPNGGFRVK